VDCVVKLDDDVLHVPRLYKLHKGTGRDEQGERTFRNLIPRCALSFVCNF
jgi:hypothetical protein